ncbi:hypothetical protein V8G54_016867 [Vigna mungo]|uniref:Uncharacterized protein n=1 Tax=Vigna mungo TaxID=3915 RepID=A0AAQ3NPM3_VIGMU
MKKTTLLFYYRRHNIKKLKHLLLSFCGGCGSRYKGGGSGHQGLFVPWKSLGKEPVIVLIDRVFVLAHPAADSRTLKEEDREKLFEAKLQQIEVRLYVDFVKCILTFTNILAVVVSNYISASQGLFPSVYEQKTPKKDIEDN